MVGTAAGPRSWTMHSLASFAAAKWIDVYPSRPRAWGRGVGGEGVGQEQPVVIPGGAKARDAREGDPGGDTSSTSEKVGAVQRLFFHDGCVAIRGLPSLASRHLFLTRRQLR